MPRYNNDPSTERNTLKAALVAGVAGIALTGCANATEDKEQPVIVFDDLGGGSSTIFVYQGPSESAADREIAGSFEDGKKSAVVCERIGRLVISDTSVDEEAVSSNIWYELPDGRSATATYANPAEGSVPIPPC